MTRLLAAVSFAMSVLMSATGQAAELRFAFPAPPQSLVNVWGFQPWAKEIKEASKGAVDIKIIPGPTLGTFATIYDRTANGVTDIAFGIFGPISARFPKTDVVSMPFVIENPAEGSLAVWRLYKSGVISDEYKDVKVLGLFTFGNPAVHTKDKEITAVGQLKGMKIGASGKFYSDVLSALEAAPQSTDPSEMYLGVSRGLFEGVLVQWTAFQTFKLAEVSKYHFEAPLGASAGYVVMNKASFDRLPADAKAVLEKFSGESLARHMGDVLSRMDAGAREQAKKLGSHEFHSITAEDRKTWGAKLQPVIDGWVKATPNGDAVLAALRKELEGIRAGR